MADDAKGRMPAGGTVRVRLNDQARAVIDELEALGPKPIESLDPEEARRQPSFTDAVRSLLRRRGEDAGPEPVGGVEDRTIPGPGGPVRIRVYRPRGGAGLLARAREAVSPGGAALPVLVYVHGGGWVLFDLDTYDASPRALANRAGCIVVSVEYRHAPEHPFPAAHEDVLAATRWVMENAAGIGGDPQRVAIGGESVGGNMATATCLQLKRAGGRLPVFQVLVYPVTDLVGEDYRSYGDSADAKPLNVPMLEWFARHALADPAQAEDARLSPLGAPTGELAGMPPAIVITAESDPLRDQGEAYALKLMDAGVHVSLTRFPGVMHEFFGMTKALDAARLAVAQAALAVRAGFEGREPAAQEGGPQAHPRGTAMNRPISPKTHGAIDYGFLAANLLAPSLLGLRGPARALSYLFGGAQGGLNAFTDQPLALKRLVPFRTHGTIELSGGPLFVALPWLTGALKDPRARAYFLALGAVLVAVYNLTDWDAIPRE